MAYTLGVMVSDMYPAKVSARLRAAGANCIARNCGHAGFKTQDLLSIIPQQLMVISSQGQRGTVFEVPTACTLMIGVNDPGTYSQAQTQSQIEQIIRAIRNGVSGVVAAPANLPAYQTYGFKPLIPNESRYLVQADNSGTGGYNIGSPPNLPTVTGDLSGSPAPRIWIYRNAQAGPSGWSRIADNADPTQGCQRILVMSAHWLNFANGLGDTLSADYSNYGPVRAAQLAAANAQGVPFFDLHAYLKSLVASGVVGDSTGATTAWGNDQHPNVLMHEMITNGLYSALTGDNTFITSAVQMPVGGWISALK